MNISNKCRWLIIKATTIHGKYKHLFKKCKNIISKPTIVFHNTCLTGNFGSKILHLSHMEYTTRNLHINDWFFGLLFNCKCNMWLQFALCTLDKLHKISIAKDNTWTIHGTKSKWQSHEDVIYMNISSIQINLCDIVICNCVYN
jgi:hypothetical protein